MYHTFRIVGDIFHASSLLTFLYVVGIRGNAKGVSLKSHHLYLLVFLSRYLDIFTEFNGWYNSIMKMFFVLSTIGIIDTITRIEPARFTYIPSQDALSHWEMAIAAGVAGLVIHVVGSGVVEIKGSSGQELEVHLENYKWLSFFWTFSICLEPLAMIPQLYIFRKDRLIRWDVRLAIGLRFLYRLCHVISWTIVYIRDEDVKRHLLLHISGVLQCLTYIDFVFYHWSVATLWCLSKYAWLTGDSRPMLEDSGVGEWAREASAEADPLDVEMNNLIDEVEAGWKPDAKPVRPQLELKPIKKLGLI